jgi:hypothetical protein
MFTRCADRSPTPESMDSISLAPLALSADAPPGAQNEMEASPGIEPGCKDLQSSA